MTNKRFRKLIRAYYTKLNMARNCKIQHGVEYNYNESMYQHIYDVITCKIEL